jgi:hypothetical protein
MRQYNIASIVFIPTLFIISLRPLPYKEKHPTSLLSDTIKPKIDYTFKTNCSDQFKGYFFRFGFWISNYYTVCDYKGLNGDTVAVLSPKILTPEASSCRNQNEKLVNSRLLLVNRKNMKSVFEKAIENDIGAGTCGGEFVEMTSNGFILSREVGQGCKFNYSINIKYLHNDFYITNITLEAHCPADTIPNKINIKFNSYELKLSDYNRSLPDSLRRLFDI